VGDELEEPKEPQTCKIRVINGARVLEKVLDEVKRPLYEYNSVISRHGYYLKPVHKVYKRLSDGSLRVYEYYGRYWWKLRRVSGRLRWIYVGNVKPKGLPEPPPHALDGVIVIREGEDIIIDCDLYDKFKNVFSGLPVEKYE
jgi:hypothetical protein